MGVYQTHFAEDIVKNEIQKKFKTKYNVWIPSKDTGIDILLTDQENKKTVSLQVKWSKNYTEDSLNKNSYWGWFQFKKKKIENSKADFWVLVIPSNYEKKFQFVIIKPQELMNMYEVNGLSQDIINSYIDICDDKVYESRGLTKEERLHQTLQPNEKVSTRELSQYLNSWEKVIERLK
jgi:hypothetical protein